MGLVPRDAGHEQLLRRDGSVINNAVSVKVVTSAGRASGDKPLWKGRLTHVPRVGEQVTLKDGLTHDVEYLDWVHPGVDMEVVIVVSE